MPVAGGLKETLIRDLRALPPPTPRVTARMTAEFDALGHLSELLLSFEHEYEAIEQSVWHVQRVLSDTKVYPHAREGLVLAKHELAQLRGALDRLQMEKVDALSFADLSDERRGALGDRRRQLTADIAELDAQIVRANAEVEACLAGAAAAGGSPRASARELTPRVGGAAAARARLPAPLPSPPRASPSNRAPASAANMDEIDRLRRENAELRRLAELRSENDALRQQLELPPEPPPQQKEVDAAVAALEAFESFERAAAPPDPPDDDATASPARAARSPRAFAPRGSAGAAPAPHDDAERRAHMYANALVAIYERHNPDKLESIPSLLAKWEGREDELLFKARAARARLSPCSPRPRA